MASLCLCIMLFFIPYVAVSQTVVKFLPGYEGPLPFYLETGYVGVGESEDIQLFYYFIKSESNPQEDPLMLWLSGGPGCSSFKGLVYEIGPVSFRAEKYNGSLPTLVLNPYSWTKTSNIIFLDSPVGAGFSYARIPSVSWSSDTLQPQLIHEFLKKWLIVHPEFSTNAFYVGGDSYSGIIVPGVVQEISNGNECNKRINLQGYILGNPITDRDLEVKMEVPFAHGMGLISDEIYESLKSSCGGEYDNIDPNNANCLKAKDEYNKCIAKINTRHILEPECPFPWATFPKRRSLYKKFEDFQSAESLLQTYVCGVTRNYAYALSTYWANDHAVREALHIRKGTVGLWEGCITANYTFNVDSSFQYHVNLSSKGYHSLVYSGDHDFLVPFLSTQAWIRNLNYSIIDDWRPWIVEGQVAGYTRTYSNQMTFATVKGGGHTAPEYRPKECFSMFKRWISHETI